jgi:D-xylose transport system permease protein
MAEASTTAPNVVQEGEPRESTGRSLRSIVTATEIDLRMFGMLGALFVIWVGFHIMSGGTFLTPRNLWFLTVQTAVVAIMATGMVLIIVTRNIDLSVGSVLGFVGVFVALLQAEWLPRTLGLGFDHPATWIVALVVALILGGLIGAFHGVLIAYVGIPAFIVTLGGLLVWRGGAWALASGRTIAPMDSTFRLLGGGAGGAIGETLSWAVGLVACVGIIALLVLGRRQRRRYGFPLRPVWAEITLAAVGSAMILGGIFVINRYYLPENLARRYAETNGIPWPEGGLQIPIGLANPVLIAIAVALVMTFIARRLRFGRYVFAIGGNPEAAALAGVNTKRTIVKAFALMGVLVGLAASVSIARLNAATSGLGTLSELYVIAAAVIGGTSLAGGIGTIPGAVLGALVMQSLQSGMVLMGVDAPIQDIVVGIVLVFAVGIDTIYRRRLV